MAQTRTAMRDGVFWGTTAVIFAAIFAGAIAYVFARFYGAGWLSGGALGLVILLVAGVILVSSANAATLPGPNELKAPVAPAGGAFQAPTGGAHRAPGAPVRREEPPSAFTPAPAESFADMSQSAGEAVGKAAYSASAAVTSAAQAARDAISGVIGSDDPAPARVAPDDRASARVSPEPASARVAPEPASARVAPEPASAPAAPGDAVPLRAASVDAGPAVKPAALDAPREGGADDLKRIRGVGPKLEELLHSLGVYHFEQIAGWGPAELAWIDDNLEGFTGRASRDDWVGQSKILAAGGETEHSQRVDRGEST